MEIVLFQSIKLVWLFMRLESEKDLSWIKVVPELRGSAS